MSSSALYLDFAFDFDFDLDLDLELDLDLFDPLKNSSMGDSLTAGVIGFS